MLGVGRSLLSRLLLNWAIFSLLVFFTLPATVDLPLAAFGIGGSRGMGEVPDRASSVNFGLEGLTTKRARQIVLASIKKDPAGDLHIEDTPAMKNYRLLNPEFRFAVFYPETGALLPGSSSELADYFKGQTTQIHIIGSMFHILNDPNERSRGYIRVANTRFGLLGTIVYGAQFHWDDIAYQLYVNFNLINIVSYLPLLVVLSVVALIVMTNGLRPLRSAASMVAEIDLDTTSRSIPLDHLPKEVTPFVEAVNGAFKRVTDGIERERRFIANSAHELRTPIAILRSRIERMEPGELKREIKRDTKRVQTILDQLLVLAQMEARGNNHALGAINLSELAKNAAADYSPIALDLGKSLEFNGPDEPVFAKGIRWAMESVMTNLIENAVRAEPPGGTVIVRLSKDAAIEVVDHGEGVATADRERIFEPFWRKSENTPGTGLGLAITKELTTKLGGSIELLETPGGGATFKVTFQQFEDTPRPYQKNSSDQLLEHTGKLTAPS
ncbi:MAG: HAMP domain-containing histidine kinase [Alphaproteobacteria bacterium]|nr:HAMP domain-containing histidine kinase [Alphaproteobacteria bacterium]